MEIKALIEMIAQAQPLGGAARDAAQQSAGLYAALLYALVLLIIFAFSTYALLRLSRRYKERLQRKPDQPTPAPDVWSMHKTPQQTDPGPSDEEPDHEP